VGKIISELVPFPRQPKANQPNLKLIAKGQNLVEDVERFAIGAVTLVQRPDRTGTVGEPEDNDAALVSVQKPEK
jgi:hypothetical protein